MLEGREGLQFARTGRPQANNANTQQCARAHECVCVCVCYAGAVSIYEGGGSSRYSHVTVTSVIVVGCCCVGVSSNTWRCSSTALCTWTCTWTLEHEAVEAGRESEMVDVTVGEEAEGVSETDEDRRREDEDGEGKRGGGGIDSSEGRAGG